MELIGVILGGVAVALALAAFLTARSVKSLLGKVLGEDSESLEEALRRQVDEVAKVNEQVTTLQQRLTLLAQKVSLAPQKVSVVRFNPFGDTGGDQSFALAVLDEHDSGYVLSSIHGREGTRVYVKPIDLGKSKYQLSDEEEKAINQAKKRIPVN